MNRKQRNHLNNISPPPARVITNFKAPAANVEIFRTYTSVYTDQTRINYAFETAPLTRNINYSSNITQYMEYISTSPLKCTHMPYYD